MIDENYSFYRMVKKYKLIVVPFFRNIKDFLVGRISML